MVDARGEMASPSPSKSPIAAKTVLPSSTERMTRRRILATVYKGGAGNSFRNHVAARLTALHVFEGRRHKTTILSSAPPDVAAKNLPSGGSPTSALTVSKSGSSREFPGSLEKYRKLRASHDLRYNG